MTTRLVPADVQVAAKRGFIRTACQSLASAIPTSAIAITLSGEWLLGVALGVASAIVTAVLAGAASAASIVSKGIPGDYKPAPGDVSDQPDDEFDEVEQYDEAVPFDGEDDDHGV